MKQNIIGGVIGGIIVGVLLFAASFVGGPTFGSTPSRALDVDLSVNSLTTTAASTLTGVTIGSTGTAITRINTGTCYFAPNATTIAATTTKAVDCQATAAYGASGESALPGIVAGSNVVLTLSTTTAGAISGPGSGLMLSGCTASSTAGYITCGLTAINGVYTWPTSGTASGTASYIVTK